jgi:nucleoside-specific outer membrane channel protein Tsx
MINDAMSNINEYITHLDNIWQHTKQVSNSKQSVTHTVNPVSIVHLSILNTKFGHMDVRIRQVSNKKYWMEKQNITHSIEKTYRYKNTQNH